MDVQELLCTSENVIRIMSSLTKWTLQPDLNGMVLYLLPHSINKFVLFIQTSCSFFLSIENQLQKFKNDCIALEVKEFCCIEKE